MHLQDDAALSLYEWTEFMDEDEAFSRPQIRSKKTKSYFVIILKEDLMLFDRDDWEAAMIHLDPEE